MNLSGPEHQYLKSNRLADVMALIQVLALDTHSHRSEAGLLEELQGPPVSAPSWRELAKEHPEFFRVKKDGLHGVALIARHVIPETAPGVRPVLQTDFTAKLLATAIDLHDRQVRRHDRWTYLVPIWAALIGGTAAVIAALVKGGK